MRATGPGAPVSPRVRALLSRCDAELVAASLAGTPEERFVHGHLAALRAAAAVVESRGGAGRRAAPRSVWDLLVRAEPGLADWAVYLSGGAQERAAVEAARATVTPARADAVVAAAEDFQDAVRERLTGRAVAGAGAVVDAG